ncbi:MAG: hypothetical protein HZB92_02550 [Euryarchaeota archaeon]|nr:hypothetical protein [Euryarchaeota archaeon]
MSEDKPDPATGEKFFALIFVIIGFIISFKNIAYGMVAYGTGICLLGIAWTKTGEFLTLRKILIGGGLLLILCSVLYTFGILRL